MLVIIGLLIGGILVAQSMISTSKITATVAQIQQFDAGVMNFKAKYNYLPGDAPGWCTPNVDGDKDGTITAVGWGPSVAVWYGEIASFWYAWNPNEYSLIQDQVTLPNPRGANKNVPESKLGKNGSYFVATGLAVSGNAYPDLTNPQNYYGILGPDGTVVLGGSTSFFSATTSLNAAVTPVDAAALDKKIDDGNGKTGFVKSGSVGENAFSVGGLVATPLPTCSDSTSGVYAVQNPGYECTPLIRIGAQAGDPQ